MLNLTSPHPDPVRRARLGEEVLMQRCDVIVVGGGAGGLVAAREARRRGARVVLVQDGPIGGDCTFTGCIPSKALLAEAASGSSFDAAMRAVHGAVQRIAATEDAAALQREGIDVVAGRATVTSPTTVVVDGNRIVARHLIVATGSRPDIPHIPGLDEVDPLTNESVFALTELPARLIVLGGGPIGCELAQAFARLGSTVTIVESADRVLTREEPEASAVIQRALVRDGVQLLLGAHVERFERTGTSVTAAVVSSSGIDHVPADRVLVAVGRIPSGRGFGLEEVGVAIDERGAIVVDDTMATNVEGIWAIGDVVGRMQFTHAAARMGWVAAANSLSRIGRIHPFRFDDRAVPWATFTSPEVGRVGLTEDAAARAHPGARVAHLPFDRLDRAIAAGGEDGFVTLIAAPRRGSRNLGGGRLVGATVVGPTGGDVVHEAALAMQTNMFVGRLAQTTHAYPSWSMAVQLAALQFFGDSLGLSARPARVVGPAS